MRSLSTILFTFLLATSALGQTIGNYPVLVNSSFLNNPAPFTVVDLNSPATAAGNIGAVTFIWNGGECSNAVKVKFFRRSGNTLTLTAERGPFNSSGRTTVTLTPPVPVLQGDLIGITRMTECGGPVAYVPTLFEAAVQFDGDRTGSFDVGTGDTLLYFVVALFGAPSSDSEVRTQIIPVAGAAPGSGGARFKTDVFMFCPTSPRCTGRLVYHPSGTTGSPTDVSANFDMPSRTSTTFLDLVGTTLSQTGIGSIDVYVRMSTSAPNVTARIYDDAGTGGTKGFTFDALRPSEALAPFSGAGVMATPPSAQYRMNVGVRTLDAPATVNYQVFGRDSTQRAFVTKDYPANFFEQVSVAQLLGVPTQPGDTIVVYSTAGSAFAYGAIIDNTTNDSSVQLAKVLQ